LQQQLCAIGNCTLSIGIIDNATYITMQSHTHIEQKTQNKAKQNKTKNTIQKFIYYLKQVYFRI
jgi:hypothetical protein